MPTPFADPYSALSQGLMQGYQTGMAQRQFQSQQTQQAQQMKMEQERLDLAKQQAEQEKVNYLFKIQADPNTSDADSVAAHNALIPLAEKHYGIKMEPIDSWSPEYNKIAKRIFNIYQSQEYSADQKIKLMLGVYNEGKQAAQDKVKPKLDEFIKQVEGEKKQQEGFKQGELQAQSLGLSPDSPDYAAMIAGNEQTRKLIEERADPYKNLTDNQLISRKLAGDKRAEAILKEKIRIEAEKNKTKMEVNMPNPSEMTQDAQDLVNGRLNPEVFTRNSRNRQYETQLRAEVRKMSPNFDFNKAKINLQQMGRPEYIRAQENINSVLESAEIAKEYVAALNNGNIQLANQWANKFAEMTGNPAPTNWKTMAVAMAQEFNRGYSDSVVNPEGRFNKEMANLGAASSSDQLLGSLDTNIRLTKIRGNAIQRMRQPYSWEEVRGEKKGSSAPASAKSTFKSGESFEHEGFKVRVK